jgi:nitrogen fixation protein FixH
MVEVETIPWLWHMFYSISLYFGLVLAMGVVTIKQAKKHVR